MDTTHLKSQAEDLKGAIWDFLDKKKLRGKILKEAMNNLLDELDVLEDTVDSIEGGQQ